MWKVTFVVLFTFFNLSYSQTNSNLLTKYDEGVCVVPAKVVNLTKTQIQTFKPEKGFYLPLSSKYYTYQVVQFLFGRNVTKRDDLSQLCLLKNVDNTPDETDLIGKYIGFDDKIIRYTCASQKNNLGNLHCSYQSDNSDQKNLEISTDVFITLTDNKSYMVMVFCWNGESSVSEPSSLKTGGQERCYQILKNTHKSWTVVSAKKKLTKEVMDTVMEHITSLGFDPTYIYNSYYGLCDEDPDPESLSNV